MAGPLIRVFLVGGFHRHDVRIGVVGLVACRRFVDCAQSLLFISIPWHASLAVSRRIDFPIALGDRPPSSLLSFLVEDVALAGWYICVMAFIYSLTYLPFQV